MTTRAGRPAPQTTTVIDFAIPAIACLPLAVVGLDLTPADFERLRREPRLVVAGLAGPLLILPPVAILPIAAPARRPGCRPACC